MIIKYSKRELFSRDITKLELWIHKKGYGLTKGEAYRTAEQQYIHRIGYKWSKELDALVKGKPRSKVKLSQHQKRLADEQGSTKTFGEKLWAKTPIGAMSGKIG